MHCDEFHFCQVTTQKHERKKRELAGDELVFSKCLESVKKKEKETERGWFRGNEREREREREKINYRGDIKWGKKGENK